MNQNFAGGWSISGLDLSNSVLLKRVLDGNKPLAIISEWEKEKLLQYVSKINKRKFDSQEFRFKKNGAYYLAVAPKGKLKDLFDLETLQNDYFTNDISINITKASEKSIKDYFTDWDAQDDDSKIEFWETGLILGYPIENTISVYKGGIK